MPKMRKEISLDKDVVKVVDEETEKGELCLSKYVNTALREKFREKIKDGSKEKTR